MKRILSCVLIIILALSIAGCSSNTSNEAVTLKLGLPGGKDITPPELVESFKAANPNITVELDETPWNEFKKKLKMQVAASNPPNVFIMDSGYIAALGGMGAAIDLKDKIKKDINADDYSSGLYAGKDAEGHIWGIPHGLNAVGVYYNKKLFDEAGLSYPAEDWTYADMLEMAKKLTKDKDGDGVTDQYGLINGYYITDGWLPYVSAAGGAPLDETRKKSNFKDEKTIEGFRKMLEPIQNGSSPSREWITANGNGASAFYMGKVGMYMALSSHVRNINKNAPAGFEYDVQMMPVGWDGNRHCVYVPNLWSIFSKSSEAEQNASWKWIKHFLSDDSQATVADTLLSGYPIKLSALERISTKANVPSNVKVFYEGIDKYGLTLYENKSFEEWRPKVDEVTNLMVNGAMSLEEGMAEIDKKVTEALLSE